MVVKVLTAASTFTTFFSSSRRIANKPALLKNSAARSAEAEILRSRAAEIASVTGADTLVELGSGTSEKTRVLLDALREGGGLRRFVPFDVDASMLSAAGSAIQREYPGVEIAAVCGDFEEHLAKIPSGGRRLFVFLGSTIGNLVPDARAEFLATLTAVLQPGDRVSHDKYDLGRVEEVSGVGESAMSLIDFGSAGRVKLMHNHAPISKL